MYVSLNIFFRGFSACVSIDTFLYVYVFSYFRISDWFTFVSTDLAPITFVFIACGCKMRELGSKGYSFFCFQFFSKKKKLPTCLHQVIIPHDKLFHVSCDDI